MRNLEDCKAEVFRRSEERIKERKRNRNRVLAWCIPLCLLLVAGGFYIRPLLEPVDESAKSGGTNRIPDRVLGGMNFELRSDVTAYSSVLVTKGTGSTAVSKNLTDTETVGELCDFMAMYFDMSGADAIGALDGADGATGGLAGTTVKEEMTDGMDWDTICDELKEKYGLEEPLADYKLVFRMSTGEELMFCLYGNNLYNENNGCLVRLSDGQLAALKEQLQQAMGKENGK